MRKTGCCVSGCRPNNQTGRYRFPHPFKQMELFQLWLQLTCNIKLLTMEKKHVYTRYRVCGKHFDERDFNHNNRLKANAVPSLFLPVMEQHVNEQINEEHAYCRFFEKKDTIPQNPSDNGEHLKQIIQDHSYCSFEMKDSTCLQSKNVNHVNQPTAEETSQVETQTSNSQKCETPQRHRHSLLKKIGVVKTDALTPKARHLYTEAKNFKRRMTRMRKSTLSLKDRISVMERCCEETSFANLTKNFTATACTFFKNQLAGFGKKAKGRRFKIEDKILGLALYKQSPSAYKFLSNIFVLPSRVTLQKLLARIPIAPGVHESVFGPLKSTATNMKAHAKYCTLIFDEMAVEPHLQYNPHRDHVEGLEDYGKGRSLKIVNRVQVFMLRGIYKNWKQPVAYYFVNGGMKGPIIKQIIIEIIRRAKAAGLSVVSTICDQGSNNMSAINSLVGETRQKTGSQKYLFEVDGDEVIPLYDAPHLLKTIRNTLLARDIYFIDENGTKKVAKWKYIQQAWELDNTSCELRTMPKLTEYHINKEKIRKMKVSYAAQVLSRSVAATMNLLIQSNALPKEAIGTVEFILLMDNVFDSVNGAARTDRCGKSFRTCVAIGQETNIHFKLWDAALKILSSMYVKDRNRNKRMPAFINWEITLKGFQLLSRKLKSNGFTLLKPRSFNQDPLENFFGRIRQRGQRYTKPTSTAFTQFYKSLLVNGLVSKHSFGSNCEDDNSSILISLQRFITQGLPEDENVETDEPDISLMPPTFQPSKPLTKAALSYVAGYLLKVKTKLKNCTACKYNILKRPDDSDADFYSLIKQKEYGGANMTRLKYCNVAFLKNLVGAYNITKHILQRPHRNNLLKCSMDTISEFVPFNFVECEHSNQLYKDIMSNFVKLVIFNYFNGINKILTGKDLRPLPEKPAPLLLQARLLYEKRQKYVKTHNEGAAKAL